MKINSWGEEIQRAFEGVHTDFNELADEAERLEVDLTVVTEDRDELLRSLLASMIVVGHDNCMKEEYARQKGNTDQDDLTKLCTA